MAKQILVYVNGKPVEIFQGMAVRHALISCDYALYEASEKGEVIVEDERGFPLGLEGALENGSKIYTRRKGGVCS